MAGVDDERVLDMAKKLLDESQSEPALRLAQLWVQDHPASARGHELVAAAHSKLGRWNEAEAAAAECVRLRPTSARAWANWGTALREVGRFAEAQGAQRQALALEPGQPRAIAELRKLGVALPGVPTVPLQAAGLLGAHAAPSPSTALDAAPEGEAMISPGRYVLWAIIGLLGGWIAAFVGGLWAVRHRTHPVRRRLGRWTAGWGVAGGLIEAVVTLCIYLLYAAALNAVMDFTDDPLQSPLLRPTWQEVGTWTGQAGTQTEPFTVGAHWVVAWETEPAQTGPGSFRITVHEAATGAEVGVVVDMVGPGAAQTQQYGSGTYCLGVTTTQRYSVEVWDRR